MTAVLAIKIIADATKAAQGFKQAESASSTMSKRLNTASNVAKAGLLGLGAAALSAAKDAAQDAAAQTRLANALSKNAGATKASIADTEKWISATSRATGVADDELRPALATLVRSTGDVAKSQSALKTAMDVSAATGKPLQTVSAALAKGYAGQTGAIGKLVPGIDQAILKSGDMTQVMAALNQKVGGEAAAAAQTATGKYQVMVNNFNEAKEALGTGFLPLLTQLAVALAAGGVFVQNHTTAVKILAGVLAATAVTIITVNAVTKAYVAGQKIALVATKAMTVAQKALNIVLRLNPIGLIITAIALLVAGLVLAYKRSETFRGIVNKVKDAGVAAFKGIWDWVQKVIDKVRSVIDWIKKIKFPSVPKAISKLGGGAGGAPAALGGRGYAYSTLGGRGGPGDGLFSAFYSGGSGGAVVYNITINDAYDPNAVAQKLEQLILGRNRRLGRAT